ncbi:hypothetical protein SAMN02746089_02114 [Caldanaerobius fijiensis DSM 17918]|uniref:Uncharacterized protein n=1 Tax=Caldanaerobius fijiensis DSM 17918 TaxID=1121256 RepID=A0A1M5CGQ1_9THEO|nr:hypothetical protein SAMN02746089_02114 [Caldanaerobius fijiensis DSM 17918]
MAWKVKSRGIKLVYGLDAFAQIVLSLEDLARMVERGIYDLQTMGKWYEISASSFFKLFGFEQIPFSC